MDLVAVNNALSSPGARLLMRVEDKLDNGYQLVKIARVALGEAPISMGTTAIGAALKLATDPDNSTARAAIADTGLIADGLLRGLFYRGGYLHASAARIAPWLVVSRAAPRGWANIARGLGKFASAARTGLLGITGVLGAMRAAHAVSRGGWDALYRTKDGRGGVLQALGSALLIVPHPAAALAGAGVFAAELVNDLG